ncbi:MAG: hypothetical protein INR71_00150 [Terriglobus roseus]|nr:hypothetical protein [Terriglobus roseus]
MKYSFAFVGALAGQAVAGGWGDSGSYNCPANTNNQCDDHQKSGWDFGDLPKGPVGTYNGHSFSGFSCQSGGNGKRSLDKRWGGNCIAGQAHPGSGPSFSCGQDQPGFSVSHLHLDTEHDQDVEFHYDMPGGSTCKQTSPCQAGGNIINNDQCGGATAVTVQLPHTATAPCSVSVYSVGFDCSTSSTPVPPVSTPPPYSAPSIPPYSAPSVPPVSIPSIPVSIPSIPVSIPSIPASPSIPVSIPSIPVSVPSIPYSAPSKPPVYSVPTSSAETPSSPVVPPTSSVETPSSPVIPPTSSVYSPPASPPASSPPASSSTPNSPVSPSSPLPPYSVPSSVPLSTAPSSTPNSPVTPSSSVVSSSSPLPPAPCPTVLPKCLNSWLWQSGCSDNGDYECYCKQPDFASKVCDCLGAYGADDSETMEAANYFLGICAKYVPDNYGFLNGKCPKPTQPSSQPPASSTPNSPVTPSSIPQTQTTVYVTGYTTTCPVGHTVTSGSVTTTLSTPSISTIYSTTTSTICTKCTEMHTPPPVETTPASPVVPAQPTTPCTTLTISKTFTVPATYTTGESYGATIPSSSCPTTIISTITVPQVVITSTQGGPGGLAYGSTPAPAPAESTPAGAVPASPVAPPPAYGSSGLGTTYTPGKTATGTAPIPTYTGAAGKVQVGSVAGLLIGLAAVAL